MLAFWNFTIAGVLETWIWPHYHHTHNPIHLENIETIVSNKIEQGTMPAKTQETKMCFLRDDNEWIAWERKSHQLLNFQHILIKFEKIWIEVRWSNPYLAFKRKVFQYMLHSLWRNSILIKVCYSSCLINYQKGLTKNKPERKVFCHSGLSKDTLQCF